MLDNERHAPRVPLLGPSVSSCARLLKTLTSVDRQLSLQAMMARNPSRKSSKQVKQSRTSSSLWMWTCGREGQVRPCTCHWARAGLRPSQQGAVGLQPRGVHGEGGGGVGVVLCGARSGSVSVTALCPMPGTRGSLVTFVQRLRAGEPHGSLVELQVASGMISFNPTQMGLPGLREAERLLQLGTSVQLEHLVGPEPLVGTCVCVPARVCVDVCSHSCVHGGRQSGTVSQQGQNPWTLTQRPSAMHMG